MDENDNNEDFDSTNEEVEDTIDNEDETTEEEADEVETEEEESDNEDETEALQKKVKELEAQKKHWKTKAAKKAEVKENVELSQNDLYTLIKNDVHEDDIEEVVAFAKLKNIGIKEALKSGVVKAILKENTEVRQTAQVTNTGTTRKSNTSKDADTLVAKAKKGELPKSDEDMKKLFLRMKGLDK